MHLRPPSVDHGVQSFIWAIVFFVILWLGMLAVGVSKGTAFILALVAAVGIFLYVRTFGVDEVRPRRAERRR
jgi:Flp pilus assembly protein TadB